MSRVVRSSKFRHVFGSVAKKEDCYDDLKITRNAWDSNFVTANPKYFAVIWESGGGGTFAVIPWSQSGKVNPNLPLVAGHKGAVLDIDFNPFNDNLIASVSEDCTGKIWGIPEGGLKSTLTEPLQTLNGHRRKVGTVQFNLVANNILATSSTDFSVKVWDIERGKDVFSLDGQHTDIINACDWNVSGSLLATACKDKKIRVIDPRQSKVTGEAEGHQGIKGSRVIWLGNDKLFSVGFTKTSEREFAIWDPRDMSKTLTRQAVDTSSGLLMPFYDRDTNVLFLGGKGDGNIRYYEVVDEAPYIHYLTEFKSNVPQRGLGMMPKRGVSVSDCEIVRMMKLSVNKMEPISFQVPRKSDIFQPDLFPDCFSGEPALTAEQWIAGENAEPKTASLEGGFVKKESAAFNPTPVQEEKAMSEKELKDEYEALKKRVAYLEAELVKRDAKIKDLENK
jgi:WD40 repeat protein